MTLLGLHYPIATVTAQLNASCIEDDRITDIPNDPLNVHAAENLLPQDRRVSLHLATTTLRLIHGCTITQREQQRAYARTAYILLDKIPAALQIADRFLVIMMTQHRNAEVWPIQVTWINSDNCSDEVHDTSMWLEG